MGRYLIVDGIENNSKCISYPMARLIGTVYPKKDVDNDDGFVLNQKEVANVLYSVNKLICDDKFLQNYINYHKDDYNMNSKFEEIKDVFIIIQQTFAKVLSRMVLNDTPCISCLWK